MSCSNDDRVPGNRPLRRRRPRHRRDLDAGAGGVGGRPGLAGRVARADRCCRPRWPGRSRRSGRGIRTAAASPPTSGWRSGRRRRPRSAGASTSRCRSAHRPRWRSPAGTWPTCWVAAGPPNSATFALVMAAVFTMNWFGLRISGRVQLVLTGVLATLLVVTVIAALPHARLANLTPFAPHGWSAVGRGGGRPGLGLRRLGGGVVAVGRVPQPAPRRAPRRRGRGRRGRRPLLRRGRDQRAGARPGAGRQSRAAGRPARRRGRRAGADRHRDRRGAAHPGRGQRLPGRGVAAGCGAGPGRRPPGPAHRHSPQVARGGHRRRPGGGRAPGEPAHHRCCWSPAVSPWCTCWAPRPPCDCCRPAGPGAARRWGSWRSSGCSGSTARPALLSLAFAAGAIVYQVVRTRSFQLVRTRSAKMSSPGAIRSAATAPNPNTKPAACVADS